MKKLLFVAAILFSFNFLLPGQEIKLMTYNLRYDNPNDGENIWTNRRGYLLSQITYYEPDIFGTQEGLENQLEWIKANLEHYSFIGVGRDDGKAKGEHSAIFYNQEKFNVIDSGNFWLSETIDKPSKGWDAALNRICSYALFEDKKEGTKFWVLNVHFDDQGEIARENSAELILNQIKTINDKNYPCILMGDFNSPPKTVAIQKIVKVLNDSRAICTSKPFGPEETYCGFDVCQRPPERDDYIFTSRDNITVSKYAAIVNVFNLHYASDHYPVLATISFKK
jgi:endonuclease/exonuclease/phosphatase family metal-dependent hydrolase